MDSIKLLTCTGVSPEYTKKMSDLSNIIMNGDVRSIPRLYRYCRRFVMPIIIKNYSEQSMFEKITVTTIDKLICGDYDSDELIFMVGVISTLVHMVENKSIRWVKECNTEGMDDNAYQYIRSISFIIDIYTLTKKNKIPYKRYQQSTEALANIRKELLSHKIIFSV